jgi:hypothetical protein
VQSCCIHVSPVRLLCRSSALITSYLHMRMNENE